jgi:hypothetical protein
MNCKSEKSIYLRGTSLSFVKHGKRNAWSFFHAALVRFHRRFALVIVNYTSKSKSVSNRAGFESRTEIAAGAESLVAHL